MYFITICTKDRQEFFGRVENGEMVLSDMGKIIQDELLQTPKIRPNVKLDEWVIMPNHIHVIIEICNARVPVETPRRGVSTNGNKRGGYNPKWKPNSIGSIINQLKSICTKRILKLENVTFAWQSRFYDHIIRNEISLDKIREYIRTNPQMWERDRNNIENLWI